MADTATLAPPLAALQLVRQAFPATPRWDLPLDVRGDGTGRLVFSTLRTRVPLQAIALVDPQGREVWRRSPAQLSVVPQREAQSPALGDAIPLPEQANPAAGRWLLRLERAPGAAGGEVTLTWQQVPRFVLGLWRTDGSPSVNQPLLLTLRPTDQGAAVTNAAALTLVVQPPGGEPALVLSPRQDLQAPTGGPVSQEPGAYLAAWRPARPGPHEIQARWQPPGTEPLVAVQRVEVLPPSAEVRFTGLSAEGLPDCVRHLVLRFAVRLPAAPAPGATHTLLVRLQGARMLWQVSAAVALTGHEGVAELRLPPAQLRQLGWPLQQIASTQLLRFTPDLKPLATGDSVALASWLPSAPLCP